MNDYMKGTIDACDQLTTTKKKFISFVKKTTGLTEKSAMKNPYIKEIHGSKK